MHFVCYFFIIIFSNPAYQQNNLPRLRNEKINQYPAHYHCLFNCKHDNECIANTGAKLLTNNGQIISCWEQQNNIKMHVFIKLHRAHRQTLQLGFSNFPFPPITGYYVTDVHFLTLYMHIQLKV